MADWTKPFTAAYTWWRVDRKSYPPTQSYPDEYTAFYATGTEIEQITNITQGTLQLNDSTETFETGIVSCVGPLDIGTDLLRCKMTATWDDGTSEEVVLGTYNVSIPSRDVHGSYEECSAILDGRLMELQQDYLENPITLPKGNNGWYYAGHLLRDRCITFGIGGWDGAYALKSTRTYGIGTDDTAASILSIYNDIMVNTQYARAAKTDGYGRVLLLEPIDYDDPPVWTFEEGINATFLSDVTDERDTTGACNVVVCVYETDDATIIGTAEDTDPTSPWSIANYGRRKVAVYSYSDNPPGANATQMQNNADAKAATMLDENRSIIRRLTVRHVWCGARVGDIVQVSYPSAGIYGSFAIRTQTIEVGSAGCMTTSELRRFERA